MGGNISLLLWMRLMCRKVVACLLRHRSTMVDDAIGAEESVLDTVMK